MQRVHCFAQVALFLMGVCWVGCDGEDEDAIAESQELEDGAMPEAAMFADREGPQEEPAGGSPGDDAPDPLLADQPEPIAVYQGWTDYTSEEYPPVSCDGGSLVAAAGCHGKYCDNIQLYCSPKGVAAGGTSWTSYFSEEATNYRKCAANAWLSGIACKGKYCDNIALQCTTYASLTPRNCYWTGWMSEENGGALSFGANYFARGVQCSGAYCDNKRYYVCQR